MQAVTRVRSNLDMRSKIQGGPFVIDSTGYVDTLRFVDW